MSDRRRPDHYSRKAQDEGFAARSVYKLQEIDEKARLLPRGGGRVLDLGCCPGSWSAYARQVGGPQLSLVGVDVSPTPRYAGVFLQGSIYDIDPQQLIEKLGGPADLVMSDMAPNTSGHRFTDHTRQIALVDQALVVAVAVLRVGGSFVAKVFEGEEAKGLEERVKAHFAEVKRVKPKATRSESVELFLVATRKRAAEAAPRPQA